NFCGAWKCPSLTHAQQKPCYAKAHYTGYKTVEHVCQRPPDNHQSISSLGTQNIQNPSPYGIHRSISQKKKTHNHPIFRVFYGNGFFDFTYSNRKVLPVEVIDSCCQGNHTYNPPAKVFYFFHVIII